MEYYLIRYMKEETKGKDGNLVNRKIMNVLILVSMIIIVTISGCAKAQTHETNSDTTRTLPPHTGSIIDQVRLSNHNKMFAILIQEKELSSSFQYSDECLKCHSEIAILYDKNAKVTDFMKGGKYADQREGITCLVCHKIGGEKMVSLLKTGWQTCNGCHTNGTPTLGKEVIYSQKEMIEGIGVGDVPNKPSYKWASMNDTFSCVDCHVTDGQRHDFMVPGVSATYDDLGITRTGTSLDYEEFRTTFNQEKCITCHYDPVDTIDKTKIHQAEITLKLNKLKPMFESWGKKVATLKPNDPNVQIFNNARTYYSYVTADASKGAHNFALAKELLEKAEIEINKLK